MAVHTPDEKKPKPKTKKTIGTGHKTGHKSVHKKTKK